MTWTLTIAYVAAGLVLVAALRVRADEAVLRRLKEHPPVSPRGPASPEERSFPPDAEASPGAGELLRVRAACGGALALLALTAWPSWGPGALLLAAMLGAGGAALPRFVEGRRRAARRAMLAVAVPDLLDLVAVSVSAGLTPRLALDRAAATLAGPLGAQLQRARGGVAMGASWRLALKELAGREGLEELSRLARVLERGDRLGTPVAERLRRLAREVRADRRAAEEERARRAPVVMLFPLVFLFLPAFVLAALVPAVLVATRGIP